jgi:hypothetical protein
MARVHLTSVTDGRPETPEVDRFPVRHLRACAAQDRRRRHQLEEDPAGADVILFVEGNRDLAGGPFFSEVRAARLYQRYPERCFLHSGVDRVVPFLPGIYPSLERSWSWPGWTRGGCYLIQKNPFLAGAAAATRQYLASFVGCSGETPVRHRLRALERSPGFLVRDTTTAFVGAIRRGDQAALNQLKAAYGEVCAASKFMLCPRGVGASSVRLFEAMELGIAPVVLADDWVEPVGPRWADFAVRVAERDVIRLPQILAAREPDHLRLGSAARRAWEDHYAPETLFDTVVEDCLAIAGARRVPRAGLRLAAHAQIVRPVHLRQLARQVRASLGL